MKIRQYRKLVGLGSILLASSIIAVATHSTYGQGRGKPTYQRVQFGESMPSVDLPSAAGEGDLMPPLNDVQDRSGSDGSGTRMTPDMMDPLPDSDYEIPLAEEAFDEGRFEQPSLVEGEPIPTPYPAEQPYLMDDGYGEAAAPIYSTGTWFRRGRWYTDLEVMYMTRTDPRNLGIIPPLPGAVGTLLRPQYTLEDLMKQQFSPGARITVGRFLGRDVANRDHMVEIEFMGGFEWHDNRLLRSGQPQGTGGLSTLLNGGTFGDRSDLWLPFLSSDLQTFRWETDFNQVQFNYLLASRPGRDQLAMQPDGRWVRHGAASQMRTIFAGLRYAQLNDRFHNTAIRQGGTVEQVTFNPNNGAVISREPLEGGQDDAVNGTYQVLTNNDMFGLNFGAEMEEKYDEWSWGLRGGFAGLANFAQRRSRIESTTGEETVIDSGVDENGLPFDIVEVDYETDILGQEVSDDTATLVIDLGLFATYQLRPNLHFKAEYNLSYFTGLALATENLVFSNGFPDLNLNGSTLLHGGSFGLEAIW